MSSRATTLVTIGGIIFLASCAAPTQSDRGGGSESESSTSQPCASVKERLTSPNVRGVRVTYEPASAQGLTKLNLSVNSSGFSGTARASMGGNEGEVSVNIDASGMYYMDPVSNE